MTAGLATQTDPVVGAEHLLHRALAAAQPVAQFLACLRVEQPQPAVCPTSKQRFPIGAVADILD